MMSLNLRGKPNSIYTVPVDKMVTWDFPTNDWGLIQNVCDPRLALALKNQGCEIVAVNWDNVSFTVGGPLGPPVPEAA